MWSVPPGARMRSVGGVGLAAVLAAAAGCSATPAPMATADLLAQNEVAREAMAASGRRAMTEGREIVDAFMAREPAPITITVTEHIGHQYALEDYSPETEAFCGREVGGRRASTPAVGGSMYRWYDLDPHQQVRRCIPYYRIKRVESGRRRGFLGAARR